MSTFDEWMKSYYVKHGFISSVEEMKAAWNARGKVDAEICRDRATMTDYPRITELCAEAIEQENGQ